ncbi:peptidase [Bacillus paramobilis]|uniref:peptidase n=2 Tax=Bacillaceae TaxID=186817 RepID=UPI000EA00F70|nr:MULTISPECIES: peptidase [Bacillus]AYF07700.1 peptidase [Bacillus mobilis]HDX9572480.1 peptidase [Bacillus mobilis]
MNTIILDEIVVKNNRVDYFFSVKGNLQKYFKINNHMFLEYNYDISDIPNSILAIPFFSNVIPLVWITDSTILINELDESFYECLNNIKTAYQNMFPSVRFKGSIVVDKIIDNTYTPELEAASLFSGGLDALTTFIRIKDKKPLLITEYGWHEGNIEESDVWEADKENAINFAKCQGLENILIQSNYGTFINAGNIDHDFRRKLEDTWWHGLHHGLAIISAAIPIAFKLKIKCIYIASSNSPLYEVTCASDPTVDNEIRYASGQVFHDGYELNRQNKVKVVVDHYSAIKKLVNIRVCFKNEENCCKCEKCLRTIMGIIAEGQDPRSYGFNIPNDIFRYIKTSLDNEVKFFTDTFIVIYWNIIQVRMKENYNNILYKDLLDWFLDYDFKAQRRKSLLKYRVIKFFPILKRKVGTKLSRMFAQNN